MLVVWVRDLTFGVCRPGFRRRARRHDPRPVSSRGSENAVVTNEVEPRRRDQCGELLQQFEGFESDVGRAVASAVFEFVEQTPAGQPRQPFGRQRGARSITA